MYRFTHLAPYIVRMQIANTSYIVIRREYNIRHGVMSSKPFIIDLLGLWLLNRDYKTDTEYIVCSDAADCSG